jgi:hypothetical protein
MGFDDLEAAERDRQDGADESAETEPDSTTDSTPDSASSESSDGISGSDGDGATGRADAGGVSDEPAFEFGAVKQSPMYARPEAWNALEDALDLDVVRALREAGVRNEEKRELHDAALRVAAEHPEEIAEAVQAARRGDE